MSPPRAFLPIALLALAWSAPSGARRAACTGGRWVQPSPIVSAGSDAGFDAVTIDGGRVSIDGGCGTTRVRLRGLRDGGTRVRARWARCGTLRAVRLAATIGGDQPCDRLVGTVTARHRPTAPVAATSTRCGDGIVDPLSDETCDTSGPSCTDRCATSPGWNAPIVAPARTWTWVPFPNAFCANGAPTGIGVDPGGPGGRLFVFLNGGGACWDESTCYVSKIASYVDTGFGAANFAAASGQLTGGFFDRDDPTNPFRDDSFVFVPYCTGDVHAGSNPDAVYGGRRTRHVGFENMTAYLARLVPTFAGASRVILSGSSAGGYGALTNWWQTQQAFGPVRVDLLDDSGPPLPAPYASASLEQTWRTAWNLDAAIPPGCTACTRDLDAILGFYGTVFAGHRAALLSYTRDAVIRFFYGIDAPGMEAGLDAIAAELAPFDVWRHFYVDGSMHTMLGSPAASQNGVSVRAFVTAMVTDDPAWADVAP